MDSYADFAGPAQPLLAVSDPLRNGISSFDNSLDREKPRHAVEVIQREAFKNERLSREEMISRTFGQAAVLALRREQNALAQFRRGPGMQSSLIGLEISMGIHDKIDFCDYMGGPSRSERTVDYHATMEKRFDDLNM